MKSLIDMIWVEMKKAVRSGIPLWTALGSLFMPLGIALLIFISKNPEIAKKLGILSAKANLIAYSATDWASYLKLTGELIAAAGLFLFVIVISWVFGREFTDGTLKDLLAVPVQRSSILLAKFLVSALWSVMLTLVIFIFSLVMGAVIGLPGGSKEVLLQGSILVLTTAFLVIAAVLPFAFFASAGRGVLLPLGIAILTVMTANLVAVAGWGEYFPWAVPGLFAMGESPLTPASYWIVLLTGLVGMFVTYLWMKNADQNR